MDGKLRIERDREDLYILEVNDKGETIEFDLTDINLPAKMIKCSENLEKKDKEYHQKILELENQNLSNEEKAKKIIEIDEEYCKTMREDFDGFLGEGACQKIFGDRNTYGMYLKLFEQLEPHFEKMIIKSKKAQQRLIDKYMPKIDRKI